MTNLEFEKAICDYLDGKINKEKLSEAFYWVAERVVNYFDSEIEKEDAIQECIIICWEKLPRYNRQKGVAWNFFTTISLGLLRQTYRNKKNYQELKKEFLKL